MLVVGSSNADLVLPLARLPRPGETVRTPAFTVFPGGKGANQAVAAARAGGRVEFAARIGREDWGARALRTLRHQGVGISGVIRDRHAPSGMALVCVDARGENLIAVASGANGRLAPRDLRRVKQKIAAADVVVTQLEIPLPTVVALAAMTRAAGKIFILNPAPACPLPAALLRLTSVLTPNEGEAAILSGRAHGRRNPAAAAAAGLLARGVGAVVITQGRRGACVATAAGRTRVAGHAVKAVDTTGAGDVFNGALAVALAEGQSLHASVSFANAAAAISVTRPGAQAAAPTRTEIEDLLRRPPTTKP